MMAMTAISARPPIVLSGTIGFSKRGSSSTGASASASGGSS